MRRKFLTSQGNAGVVWKPKMHCVPAFTSCAGMALWSTPAGAHAGERGQIMLLPTGFYMLGGVLAVSASVILVGSMPALARWKVRVLEFSFSGTWAGWKSLPSILSLALLSVLVLAGLSGPGDPISNPLPGFIWSLWWVGFTLLCLLFGNLWPLFNPWTGLLQVITAATGRYRPPLRYPIWLVHWPAVIMFAAFAWFELVYPAPDDPPRLAAAVVGYFGANMAGLLLFGEMEWLGKAECFSVYFRIAGRLSPCQWSMLNGRLIFRLGLPGHGLLRSEWVSPSETAFVLLALATVSFDGFSHSFFWIDALGLNPLEFPGRSAVELANTLGFLTMFLCLSAAFAMAVKLGSITAQQPVVPGLVMAIAPIALAYHVAHYLPEFPIGIMRATKALSNPFGAGLNLLGTAGLNPPASLMMDHRVATLVYRLQTAIIVIGHVMAVMVAHILALRSTAETRTIVVSQAPLNILMVLYTLFGLWLLSTPVIS